MSSHSSNVSRETIDWPELVEAQCWFCGKWYEEFLSVVRFRCRFGLRDICIDCDPSAKERVGLPLSSITNLNTHPDLAEGTDE